MAILNYDYGIEYGDFTSIYTHHKKNKQIVDEIQSITDKLENSNDVFVIGYGASGSGKTSSLIKLVTTNENGIFINL